MVFMRQANLIIGVCFICLGLPAGALFTTLAVLLGDLRLLLGPCIGLLFATIGICLLTSAIKLSRRERRLVATGRPVQCKLVSFLQTSLYISNQHLVRAVVLSPEGRTYRSVGFNPRNLYLQIGQPIVAFVDPADPDDVWVDVYPTGRG